MTELLSIKGVSKHFGGVQAVKEVSLDVPEGKIIGLIGPNGSGKSTLFSAIVGYIPIDTGSIQLNGQEISLLNVQKIARMGLVRTFQETRIFSKMSCLENLLIALPHTNQPYFDMFTRYSKEEISKAESLLSFIGLEQKRDVLAQNLSFGQQKLLELAMALMNDPKILLLDEPTAGINPTLINGLMGMLKIVNKEMGITLFVIEHNMRVIMSLAEHIYCLAHGELLAQGPPDAIKNDQKVIDAYLGVT